MLLLLKPLSLILFSGSLFSKLDAKSRIFISVAPQFCFFPIGDHKLQDERCFIHRLNPSPVILTLEIFLEEFALKVSVVPGPCLTDNALSPRFLIAMSSKQYNITFFPAGPRQKDGPCFCIHSVNLCLFIGFLYLDGYFLIYVGKIFFNDFVEYVFCAFELVFFFFFYSYYSKQKDGSCFRIHSVSLCLFIGELSPLILREINVQVGKVFFNNFVEYVFRAFELYSSPSSIPIIRMLGLFMVSQISWTFCFMAFLVLVFSLTVESISSIFL
ncbi:hypothetical protein STEG23_022881 [Scotinomys teguina]